MRRDVFQAIADPTRREILHLVASQPLNMETVAGNFGISRAAIYKHIKILTQCGLIIIHIKGRERYCEAQLDSLSLVSDWVEQYHRNWHTRLNFLDMYLKQAQNSLHK